MGHDMKTMTTHWGREADLHWGSLDECRKADCCERRESVRLERPQPLAHAS